MNSYRQLSSIQNPLIKQLVLLKEKSRERKKSGLFLIEGQRELRLAIKAGYKIETLLFLPEVFTPEEMQLLSKDILGTPEIIEVTKPVYQKIAYRESTEGILALAESNSHSLDVLKLKKNALVLVVESPEKPGNLGALLRTADAANLDAVLIANPKGDLYNPNVIRSSVGCVFTTNIAQGSTSDIIDFLKQNQIQIYCAALSASKTYTSASFKKASAIVVGTESTGLTEEWLTASDQNIIIPMEGEIDSMNVSVSAAILIFEAKRQRLM